MARRPRLDFPGAWHHVMHRGARREPVFKIPEHCRIFLDCVGDAVGRSALEVHAYALMPNHFHLLVRSPQGTLSRGMKALLAGYVQRVNALESWDGPMFRGRFKNQVVTRDDYLRQVMAYIHLNPVRAHLVTRPDEECWTSYRAHLGLESGPDWLSRYAVDEWFGGAKGLDAFVKAMRTGRESWADAMDTETGWFREEGAGPEVPVAVVASQPVKVGPRQSAHGLWQRLVAVTGLGREALLRPGVGRGANPGRRFAVLTLVTVEGVSQARVAEMFGLSLKAVANTVARAVKMGTEPGFRAWSDAWQASRPGGVVGRADE